MAQQAIPAFTLENFPPLMAVTTAIPAAAAIPDDEVGMVFFGSFAQGVPLLNQPFMPMAWPAPAQQIIVPISEVSDEKEGEDDGEIFFLFPFS